MALNYDDISALVDEGKTAAQIAAVLQADTRHKRDIMATSADPDETDLLDLLGSTFKVLRLSSEATWKGPLVDYFAANPDSPLIEGYELLLTQLQISNRPVRCGTDAAIGALTSGITQVVGALVSDVTAVQTNMDNLTGGPIYADITEAAVQAVIDDKARQDIVDACLTPIQADQAAATAKLNNATASLTTDLIEGLTNAELQTRCDAIAASEDGSVGA